MRLIVRWVTSGLFALICAIALGDEVYHSVREIPIGGEGGWDILTIDRTANRLYLSQATKVVVVDLGKSAVIGVDNTPGVHAFVAVPELQRGFSSNGKEDKASVVDLKTLQTTSKIDTVPNPDAIVYEPKRHEVYVFNHTGNSCTVIDPKSARVITTIQLGQSRVCSCGQSCGSDLLQHRRQKRSCGHRHIYT